MRPRTGPILLIVLAAVSLVGTSTLPAAAESFVLCTRVNRQGDITGRTPKLRTACRDREVSLGIEFNETLPVAPVAAPDVLGDTLRGTTGDQDEEVGR